MTKINPIISNNFSAPVTALPEGERNYCVFNQNRVDFFVSQKEHSIPYVTEILKTSNDEADIVEALYITDRLIDNGTKEVEKMYPALSKHNYSESPNVQTFLAGIYRKTQVPDAFGPLWAMLIRNSLKEAKMQKGKDAEQNLTDNLITLSPYNPTSHPFDANEEIGGAILEYIKNYSNNPKPIDYNA